MAGWSGWEFLMGRMSFNCLGLMIAAFAGFVLCGGILVLAAVL